MRRRLAAAVAFAALLLNPGLLTTSAQVPPACASLANLRLPDVKVTDATAVPLAATGAVRAAHCRVNGIIGTEIRFTLLLPDAWNGKLFMGGGGGFVGSVQNSAVTTVNEGYATVGTDTGHEGDGTDARWALDNLERRVNFGYLAIHRTAETAKAIATSYYARPPAQSYFFGCSRGGGQAMMSAQRFPDDFDGIVAGAPAFDWTRFATRMIRGVQAVFPDPRRLDAPVLTPDVPTTVETAIVRACDGADGLEDGILDDPRQCRFDIGTLPLTDVQKKALAIIYGPTTTRDGEVSPGQPFGGEGQPGGWAPWITGGASAAGQATPSGWFAFATGVFKYFVFNDPNWNYATYDVGNWKTDTALAATYLNATDPNLDRFKSRGGKLILWHGWSDPALSALSSIRYHEQVSARDPNAAAYFRTFLLPGVLHCGGGPGPDTVNWTGAITTWVERGQAPDRLVARKVVNGAATHTRPLCPYPQRAVYTGSGSTEAEGSFACAVR